MTRTSVPNSPESDVRIHLASSVWRSRIIRLSWAHERPNYGAGTTTVFEEEILELQVKSVMVRGRRGNDGKIVPSVWLEVDCGLRFAHGQIESLCIADESNTVAVVHFRSTPGTPAPENVTVKIERVS